MNDNKCPHCGKPYQTMTIPSLYGGGAKTVISRVCDCQASIEDAKAEHRRAMAYDLRRAWKGTGVPERFLTVQPDFNGLAEVDFAQGLYFYGPKGTGKTTAACRVLKAYVRREQRDGWVSARFLSVPDWLASMRGHWGSEEEDAFQRAAGCKLLVLDDLGKGKPTEWAMERLFRLVDSRYNRCKPTIYTSQYDLGMLGERCAVSGDTETAEAMVSRIAETCKGLHLGGPDRRIS